MTRWLLSVVLGLFAADANASYRIEHLEPAFWWVGMKHSRLQLMVHGAGIAELEPALDYPGVAVVRVTRTESPNYLFMDLMIGEGTRAGRFSIGFRRGAEVVASHEYALHEREPGSATRRGFGPADVIYLVTPDRFANGDAANDSLTGYRQAADRDDPDGRHGGDLSGVTARLGYLAGMGFTQLWMNPVQQNDQARGSYHGYAITDFYRIDGRLGDNESYRSLAREARRHGIGLVMDVVLNHCGSEHWWMKDLPSPNWINHGTRFVGTTHQRESLHDPHAAQSDREGFTDGWFVPTMPDLNQKHPLLETYLIQNSLWWIESAGLSGLRVDTWAYSDRDFLARWTTRVLDEYPELGIVGEEWSLDPAIVAHWQRGQKWRDGYETSLPSLMDFPLQDAVMRGLVEAEGHDSGLRRIYRALAGDFLYPDPERLVVFPDNHDMSRAYTQLGERLDLYKMAMAFFATTRGIPQLTYGSEILLANPGTGAHGAIRKDFPGGWAADPTNGFTGRGLTPEQREAQDFMRKLLNWRKRATAVHRGALTQYAPQDGVYAYFRHDERQTVMVVLNKSSQERRIDTARFHQVIGSRRQAADVLSGRLHRLDESLAVPGQGVTILEIQDAPRGGAAGAGSRP